jgi:lysophospholipase L1-like esterase
MLATACEREVTAPQVAEVAAADPQLTADLELVRAARVLFAHGAVGANVLEGVARIPHSGLRLDASFAQVTLSQDGDPDAKIAAFEKLLDTAPRPGADVALMMLSSSDIGGNSDTKALFTHYREAIARLKRAHPQTAFVHVTAPLTVRDTGAKELVKRLTGLADEVAAANVRRDEYNGRMRAAFRGEPIFDLAAIEALWPDGRPERFVRGGANHPSLVPAYSDDGQHLGRLGQDRAARALIHTLADALRGRPAH